MQTLHVEEKIDGIRVVNDSRPAVSFPTDIARGSQTSVTTRVAEARGAPAGHFTGRLYPKSRPRFPVRVPNGTAPGFRETASGALNYVGNDGFCYSRSGSGGYGVYLNFGMTELSSSSAYYRGYGFQLRCLSE